MTHRSRIRILGLGLAAVTLLVLPLMYQVTTARDMIEQLLIGALGVLILKSSSPSAKARWPQGVGAGLFGYYAWCQLHSVWDQSWSLSLSSVTAVASGLFAAWCCLLATMMLASAASAKGLDGTSPIPAGFTSWALGGVAVLYGVSGVLEPGQDGFISTVIAVGFAAALVAQGVMLLKNKHAAAVCYGIGLTIAIFAGWTFITNPVFDFMISFTGRLATYGVMGALVVTTFLGCLLIGTEVATAKTSTR